MKGKEGSGFINDELPVYIPCLLDAEKDIVLFVFGIKARYREIGRTAFKVDASTREVPCEDALRTIQYFDYAGYIRREYRGFGDDAADFVLADSEPNATVLTLINFLSDRSLKMSGGSNVDDVLALSKAARLLEGCLDYGVGKGGIADYFRTRCERELGIPFDFVVPGESSYLLERIVSEIEREPAAYGKEGEAGVFRRRVSEGDIARKDPILRICGEAVTLDLLKAHAMLALVGEQVVENEVLAEVFEQMARTAEERLSRNGSAPYPSCDIEIFRGLLSMFRCLAGLSEPLWNEEEASVLLGEAIMASKVNKALFRISSVSELYAVLTYASLRRGRRLRKCKHCGNAFVMEGSNATRYCRRLGEDGGLACQKLAEENRRGSKSYTNNVWGVIANKARSARRSLDDMSALADYVRYVGARYRTDTRITPEVYEGWLTAVKKAGYARLSQEAPVKPAGQCKGDRGNLRLDFFPIIWNGELRLCPPDEADVEGSPLSAILGFVREEVPANLTKGKKPRLSADAWVPGLDDWSAAVRPVRQEGDVKRDFARNRLVVDESSFRADSKRRCALGYDGSSAEYLAHGCAPESFYDPLSMVFDGDDAASLARLMIAESSYKAGCAEKSNDCVLGSRGLREALEAYDEELLLAAIAIVARCFDPYYGRNPFCDAGMPDVAVVFGERVEDVGYGAIDAFQSHFRRPIAEKNDGIDLTCSGDANTQIGSKGTAEAHWLNVQRSLSLREQLKCLERCRKTAVYCCDPRVSRKLYDELLRQHVG